VVLRLIPADWRDAVERDLREEAANRGSGRLWLAWHAVRIGLLLRMRRVRLGRHERTTPAARRAGTGDVWVARWADRLWHDVRYGARRLRRERLFALTAVLTLTLGVAATTTVFSVVDAELWRPLPYADPDRLVVAYSRGPGERSSVDAISEDEFALWRAGTPAFSELVGVVSTTRRTLRLDLAETVLVEQVTSNYFDTLNRPVLFGRTFTSADADGTRLGVLTDRAWQRVFQGDPAVVGRAVTLDAESVVIAGVVASDDSLGPDVDLFVNLDAASDAGRDRSARVFYGGIGRLAPGANAEVAEQQIQRVMARLAAIDPERWAGRTLHVEDLHGFYRRNNWRPLYFLLAAALVVLVLTTVNVASLLLVRALRRTREFALRGALGGGQPALARQLLVEGALVALPAGGLALLLAAWAVGVISSRLPEELARTTAIPIDYRAAVFAFTTVAGTAVVFGLVPLVVGRRMGLAQRLGPGDRAGESQAEGRARLVLLAAQLALTVMLVSAAGIFFKSFVALTGVPLGFDPTDVISLRTTLTGPRYESDAQVRAYVDRLLEAARSVPGVIDAAVGTSTPLASGPAVYFVDPEQPRPASVDAPDAIIRAATPGFFRTLGIPIVRGRAFDDSDAAGAPRVAVVNEHLAGLLFGGTDAVGRRIELLPDARTPWTRRPGALLIVGLANDVKEVGLNEVKFAGIYVPFAQMPSAALELVARAGVPAATLAPDLRATAARVDPVVPIRRVSTFEQRVEAALQTDRFNLVMVTVFAGVALVLAAIGIYGAVAYAVQARTRELGVRLALGARPARLIGSAIWRAGRLGVAGGLAGLALTVASARLAGDALYLVPGSHNGVLYQVSMTDPAVLSLAFLGIVGVVLVAAALPARRVASVDPVRALRSE
jgi:predicted permease